VERTGQDYKLLLYTMVAGTWAAAAGCLCEERLGERTLFFHIFTFHNTYELKIPEIAEMSKISLKFQKITCKIYISLTSSSPLGFIFKSIAWDTRKRRCHVIKI
jgi:hypothetical protein